MENKEIWKDIPSYKGLYQVSNIGRVKSLNRIVDDSRYGKRKIIGQIKNNRISPTGYYRTTLSKDSTKKTIQIHQLVAEAFLGHKRCGYELVVNHKDFNKTNNNVSNLEIVTTRENSNKKHLKSTSKYIGVYIIKNKFASCIEVNGKNKFLGLFKNEKYASIAYQLALVKIQSGTLRSGLRSPI